MADPTAETPEQPVQPAAEATAATPPAPEATAAPEEGKGGKEAVLADLAKERDRRQELEQKIAEIETASKSQLDAIAKALGLKEDEQDPTQIAQQLEDSKRQAAENAAALTRFQVAVEKAVPSHLVEFVTGQTREEVEASVEKVLAAFAGSTTRSPQPDPSQGQQGAPASLDAQIAAAREKGDTREVIRLKARKGHNNA